MRHSQSIMKEELVGDKTPVCWLTGFSTLELMIAMAIMSIVLAGVVSANYATQYWLITSQTSNEGLYKAKTKLEDLRSLVKQDFYQATSSALMRGVDSTDPGDAACISGGLCYFTQAIITDLSSCSKYVEARVSWQVPGYSTTTTSLFTNLTNWSEAIALGGDCILNQPAGNWRSTPQNVGAFNANPGKLFTGIDVLHKVIYVTASTSPYFLVYAVPAAVGQNPALIGSANGAGMRLNAVDVGKDLSTGRTYAFVAQNATTSQLGVFDVTDPSVPTLVTERRLNGITSPGLFSEGWKVFVYGGRLYMTTRETSGNEFHIFNIDTPTQPTEIGTGFQLNRTVNDLVVRDQKIGSEIRRFVFLAADANLKEIGILDVTNDVISEVASVNLSGSQDGTSVFLLGHQLYFGRASNSSGPELYVFDVKNPSAVSPSSLLGLGEIGADVTALRVSGTYAFLGTSRSGQEFQVWNADYASWNPSVLNAGRFSSFSFPHLARAAIDIDGDWVYMVSRRVSSPGDALRILYAP